MKHSKKPPLIIKEVRWSPASDEDSRYRMKKLLDLLLRLPANKMEPPCDRRSVDCGDAKDKDHGQ